jgi:cytochrome c oxidase cbb3-type subunit I/II
MPSYSWLYSQDMDTSMARKKLAAFRTLGAPYSEADVVYAEQDLKDEAKRLVNELRSQGLSAEDSLANKEIIALIAYLQKLGRDLKR